MGQLTTGWKLAGLVSVGGFFLQSTLPINVTYGQQIAPVSAATVSSLMMGFAWGVGSLLAPVVGVLGDRLGLGTALTITAVVPVFAAMAAVPLPPISTRHRSADNLPLAT
jgi:FSR family fosmidomycin resistance protein-like MFS transporter